MVNWKGRILNNPLIAFYILSFGISWALWLPWIVLRNDISEIIGGVGVFGPAFACVITARLLPARTQFAFFRYPWIAFVIAWGLSTWVLAAYSPAAASAPITLVIFAFLALPPAYVISSAFSGPPGVRATLSSLIRPPGRWVWYLIALLIPPTTRLLSAYLSRIMGCELLSNPPLPANPLDLAGAVGIVFLYTILYAGGLNEEVGWTGFALPRLNARFSPLIASIVLWFFWIFWHVPLGLVGMQDLGPHVLIGTFFGRFIFTWLFLSSSGGMLTAILFHTSVNVSSQFIPITNASLWVEGALAVVIVIGSRMWKKLPATQAKIGLADIEYIE